MWQRMILGIALVVACACSRGTPGMVDNPQWRSLMGELNLPDYKRQRLETYVHTLEGSRKILASADSATRTSARTALDREMARALPLLVPPEAVEKVHAYLRNALRQP